MKKRLLCFAFVVILAFAGTVSAQETAEKPIEYVDGRPLLKVAVVSRGCRLNHQIATDVVAYLFQEYRVGDAAGTQNLALQKRQLAEEQSPFYRRGHGQKQVGYFQSADYTLNVSVECGRLEYGSHPSVSVGQLTGEGVRAAIQAASRRRGHTSNYGYGAIRTQRYYTARVRVSMTLEASGDIVAIKSGRGEGTGRSGNFGRVFTWSEYRVDDPAKAVFDGFYKAVETAKKNMSSR